jgi:hypothetical protein
VYLQPSPLYMSLEVVVSSCDPEEGGSEALITPPLVVIPRCSGGGPGCEDCVNFMASFTRECRPMTSVVRAARSRRAWVRCVGFPICPCVIYEGTTTFICVRWSPAGSRLSGPHARCILELEGQMLVWCSGMSETIGRQESTMMMTHQDRLPPWRLC